MLYNNIVVYKNIKYCFKHSILLNFSSFINNNFFLSLFNVSKLIFYLKFIQKFIKIISLLQQTLPILLLFHLG